MALGQSLAMLQQPLRAACHASMANPHHMRLMALASILQRQLHALQHLRQRFPAAGRMQRQILRPVING